MIFASYLLKSTIYAFTETLLRAFSLSLSAMAWLRRKNAFWGFLRSLSGYLSRWRVCSMSNDKQVCRPPSKPIFKKSLINQWFIACQAWQAGTIKSAFLKYPYLSSIYVKHYNGHKKAPHLRGFNFLPFLVYFSASTSRLS